MKSTIFALSAFAVLAVTSGCAPANTPAAAAPKPGLCWSAPCQVTDSKSNVESASDFYSKFLSSTVGSCADQANMGFNTLMASAVLTKDLDGFAQVRLDINADGSYTGSYLTATGALGTDNPINQATPVASSINGKWHFGNDKIVLEGFGIGRRGNSDDELLFVPISTSSLSISNASLVSFTHVVSTVNAAGQTVAQVCAAQAAPKPKDQ